MVQNQNKKYTLIQTNNGKLGVCEVYRWKSQAFDHGEKLKGDILVSVDPCQIGEVDSWRLVDGKWIVNTVYGITDYSDFF